MLDPRPSDSAPSGRTASSGFLQGPTASRPVRKPGTSGFSRLTSVSRMGTSLSLTAFPSSTAVSPGWMPSLAAQAAGIRSLFLKPSSKLSPSRKAVGCKVRLRLALPYCPLPPLRKCAPLRFRAAGAVPHLLCAHILRGRTGTRDCILHFSAGAPALRTQTRRAESLRVPLRSLQCRAWMLRTDASLRQRLREAGPTCRGSALPARARGCLYATSCAASYRQPRPPSSCCCLRGWRTRLFRMVSRFGIETGIYSYSGHSVKSFDGMADFQ